MIALRVTFIESPHIDAFQGQAILTSEIVSLIISTVLLGCFALWLLVSVIRNRLSWRRTGLGIATGLFMLAGIVAFFVASNKRAALSDLVILITPMLSGMLLVQLLSSQEKIRLTLVLLISLGITATYQCYEQVSASNETLVADYERDMDRHLETFSIEPDSLEHWMYEHRIYSKDIRGFLMTSNSSASFFLLAIFAAIGLTLEAFRQRKRKETLVAMICYLLALALLLAGLILTASKGGIGALIASLFIFAMILVLGKSLWKHRVFVGVLLLIAVLAGGAAIVAYGISHDRLPGGNSMLVRWQYWQSTVEMIKDKPLTGLGGANFSEYYSHYKAPAASETIRDPHNWILSLVSQYGPLGLIAFLIAVLRPMYQSLTDVFSPSEPAESVQTTCHHKLWYGAFACVTVGLLCVRPFLVDSEFLRQPVDVRTAAYVVLYLLPAVCFVGAFLLLRFISARDASTGQRNHLLAISLVCGIVAVLIHNLIDFAIFEPGIWSLLWLFVAILIARVHINSPQPESTVNLTPAKRMTTFGGLGLMTAFCIVFVLSPPIKANLSYRTVRRAGTTDQILTIFQNAVEADLLSPRAPYKAAGLLVQFYKQSRIEPDVELLHRAAEYVQIAQHRNPAGFKPWRLQSEINLLLSEQAGENQNMIYLEAAYENLKQASGRYPGSGKTYYAMGALAEEIGLFSEAMQHYQAAVWIEDLYREQFKIMYPEQERVISRLGNINYETAKEKIQRLQQQLEDETTEGTETLVESI
ncbi:MAG: O-antigen ligase family protein [Planctomycetota bacterium]